MASKTAIKKPKHSKLYYVIIALCVVLLSTYITLRIIDGLRFKNIKQDIATIGEDIQSIAPATKHKTVLYCDYANMKYAQGGRSCYVKYASYYEGLNRGEAKKMYNQFTDLLGKKYLMKSVEEDIPREEDLGGYSFTARGLYCILNAWHYKNQVEAPYILESTLGVGSVTNIQGLVVSVGCSGSAMADYYPVIDN